MDYELLIAELEEARSSERDAALALAEERESGKMLLADNAGLQRQLSNARSLEYDLRASLREYEDILSQLEGQLAGLQKVCDEKDRTAADLEASLMAVTAQLRSALADFDEARGVYSLSLATLTDRVSELESAAVRWEAVENAWKRSLKGDGDSDTSGGGNEAAMLRAGARTAEQMATVLRGRLSEALEAHTAREQSLMALHEQVYIALIDVRTFLK